MQDPSVQPVKCAGIFAYKVLQEYDFTQVFTATSWEGNTSIYRVSYIQPTIKRMGVNERNATR